MKTAIDILIPAIVALLIIYALIKKVNVYKAFVAGAAEALPLIINVLPFLAAMLGAIAIFRGSGALGLLMQVLSPILQFIGIPTELSALFVLRPFSGSASLALLSDLLKEHGADSFIGRAASVLVGSTETVFYTLAVYFGAIGITKTRHALPSSLISGVVGALVGVWLLSVM